jgi:DHA2 family multidrug resistance protein
VSESAAAGVRTAPPPMQGGRLALAMLALSLGSFMNILDLSIANVSVPTIAGDLGVSYTQGTWVITSYAVAEAIMLPLTGWLAGRFGQVRMFTTATLMFTLASLLCGTSTSFPMLLAARVMQGVVGASMIPLSQTLITVISRPERRGFALGIWAMTTVVAPIAGPLAGGWLTENLSWHWVFLINLPTGLLVTALVVALLPAHESIRRKLPVDMVGLGLLVVGVGSLQILLDKGNELDWFGSNVIIALACTSVFALALFVAWELTDEHPVVDLRLFARRNFAVGVICLMIGAMAFFGTVVVLPLWLQTYQGYTALWAGKAIATGGVFAVFLGPIIGANLGRLDARAVASFGFCVFSLVAFWSARFTPDVDFFNVSLTRLFMGIGISCFFLPIISINLSGLPSERIAAATGVANFMRNIGTSFGTAILTSVWVHKASVHHARLTEQVNPYNPLSVSYLHSLGSAGYSPDQAFAQINQMITTQSYLLATNAVLCICGMMTMCLIPFVWLARRPRGVRGVAH